MWWNAGLLLKHRMSQAAGKEASKAARRHEINGGASKLDQERQAFLKTLVEKYGTLTKAWRLGLSNFQSLVVRSFFVVKIPQHPAHTSIMARMATPLVEVKTARFDIDAACEATFWKGQDQLDIDWNDDDVKMLVIGLDRKGKVIQWNERAEELTDFTQSELKGYSFAHHLMSRPFANLVDTVLERTWAGEDVGCFQIPFFTKCGKKLQLVVNASCSAHESTESLLLKALTIEDVARQQDARGYATMTVHVDLDGHINEWDAGAQQISSFTRVEMIGKDFVNTIIPATERQPLEDAFMQALMCKEHQLSSSVPLRTKVGSTQWLVFRAVPQYKFREEQIRGPLAGVVFVGSLTGEPGVQKQGCVVTFDSLPSISLEPDVCMCGSFDVDDKRLSLGMPSTCATLDSLAEIVV